MAWCTNTKLLILVGVLDVLLCCQKHFFAETEAANSSDFVFKQAVTFLVFESLHWPAQNPFLTVKTQTD